MNLKFVGVIFAVAIVALGAFTTYVGWRSKVEIERRPADAWGSGLRTKLLQGMAQDNPGLLVLDPEKLEKGTLQHLPTPAPESALQTITTTWPDGDTSDALATPHLKDEAPLDWLERHFATVDVAREFTNTRK